MSRLAAAAALICALAGGWAPGASAAGLGGAWVGTYRLPAGADPVAIGVRVHRTSATVALGPGHSSARDVPLRARGRRLQFRLPGLPAEVVFSGTRRGGLVVGTVTQGRLRGRFELHRGTSRRLFALGLYRSSGGDAVAVIQPRGFPPWLVELPDGATHGLNASLTTVGRRLGDTTGDGSLAVEPNALAWTRGGTTIRYARVPLRQQEVRVGGMAGTLTIPEGAGPFPAATMVHGSAAAGRDEFQAFAAYLESIGVAVLAADKRGVGESGGVFPGEAATEPALDVLARDAANQVRFLDSVPRLDPGRVGLLGDSQAGWVIALAAARENAVRWAVPLVGPTTTVGETDLFARLAGASESAPADTRAAVLARVREQGPSGFDPLPWLSRSSIPMLWVYGDDDRNVPTELCVERLEAVAPGHDFSWVVLHMTHALLDLPTGLYASLPQSRGFTGGLFPAIGDWLAGRGIAREPRSV